VWTPIPNVRNHPKPAFTLVELLVVIGIIALLVSILLPVLGKVQRSSRTLRCLSNLRQMGMAQSNYTSQWKGWAVPDQMGAVANDGPWPQNNSFRKALGIPLYNSSI